jgi:FtsX-like permease family/MacB-like periplasmic core domain
MNAVWARARSELRATLRGSVALILMLGLFGGAVLAATAGARRQTSAYPRFLAATGGADAVVYSAPQGFTSAVPTIDLGKVAKLPQVRRAAFLSSPFGVASLPNGDVLWDGSLSIQAADPAITPFWSPRVLSGRLPDPGRADEVAVGYLSPQDPGVHIGATLDIRLLKGGVDPFMAGDAPAPEDLLPPIAVHVVGMVVFPGELTSDNPEVFVTGEFFHRYVGDAESFPELAVDLKGGVADFPAFSKGVDAITPGAVAFTLLDEAKFVRHATDLQAAALWLFAGLAALAGLLIFAQAVTRQTIIGATENPSLRAVGMTTGQLFGVAMVRSIAIGVGSSVIAVVIALATSPLMPMGLARIIDPDRGISFDPVVLGLGGLALLVLVPVLAAWPAWRGARVRSDPLGIAAPRTNRSSLVGRGLAKAGLSPTAVTGVRMALEQGRGRTAVPVWTTVLGVTMAIAAFAASFTFLGSYRHVLATPRLYGVDFDIGVGNPFLGPDAGPAIVAILQRDPDIAQFSGGNIFEFVQVHGADGTTERLNVWAFEPIRGLVHPTISAGRWPTAADEIALGARSMRALHISLGRTITVSGGASTARLRVVGQATLPEGGLGPGLGDGVAMSLDGIRVLYPDAAENVFPINLVPGANAAAVTARLNAELAPIGADVADLRDTPNLSNFKRIQALPLLLAGLLAVAGAATLVHTLISSIRRRRRDLAILSTLGFSRGQVSGIVAWQASTLVVLALAVGLPLGIAAGRWGWYLFATQLGIVFEPRVGSIPLLLAAPATILLANLIAVLPGRAASRTKPAVVLRTE